MEELTADQEKRIEEISVNLKRAIKELKKAQESGDRKAERYALNRVESISRLHFAIMMDTEATLMLEELALVKAKEKAERHGLSMAASAVLEFTSQAHARGMTEDEFFNSEKPGEDFFIDTLRDTYGEKARADDPDIVKAVGVFLQEPESLEAAMEEVKEAKLWPWDFKQ